MTRPIKFLSGPARLAAVAMLAATGLAISQAQAFLLSGGSVSNAVTYTGQTDPNLNFSNSNVTGNIAIAGVGGFVGSGSGTVTGTVQFSAGNTEQFNPNGISVTGGATFGNANVQTDLNALNALSQSLRNEGGTTLVGGISAGGSIDASKHGMIDANDNEVFNAGINSDFVAGTTFTIDRASNQFVVINVGATSGNPLNGSIVLTGGITSDRVLFNFDAGSFDTLSGGDALMINTGGRPTTGIFLDPNGPFQITDTLLNGRIFGGDSLDSGITDSTIIAPSVVPVPAPGPKATLALLGAGLVCAHMIGRRRRPLARPAIMLSARDTSG